MYRLGMGPHRILHRPGMYRLGMGLDQNDVDAAISKAQQNLGSAGLWMAGILVMVAAVVFWPGKRRR